MATVGTLRVAPVKGLATVTRERVRIDHDGVAEDRRLFLVDDGGAVVTLRSHPELVQVAPDLDLDQGLLTVRLPDGTTASSHLDAVGEELRTELFGKGRAGRVLGGEVGPALSEVAGVRIRAVLAEQVGVGWDEGPVSLVGRASAAAVGGPAGDLARYRMLIELDGTEPYEEDTWVGREVDVGEARVRVTQPLARCVIITRSPATGDRDWDGLKALAAARGNDHVCLGVIAEVVRPGHVGRGDRAVPKA
jgi:uncharacterized protein YcbX